MNFSHDNFLKLCHEHRIMLASARAKLSVLEIVNLQQLFNENIDWDFLLNEISRHGFAQLFCKNCSDFASRLAPKKSWDKFALQVKMRAIGSMALTGALCRSLPLFAEKQIRAIPYKGPMLAYLAYGDVSLREFGDLDIYIDAADAVKVKDFFLSLGYQGFIDYASIKDDFFINTQHGYTFYDKKNGVTFDINWKPWGHYIFLPKAKKVLCDDTMQVDILGISIDSFTLENLLLIIILHATKHSWSNLSWICDIAELIRNNRMNWDEIIFKAEKIGIKRILAVNLRLAQMLFSLELNDAAMKLVIADRRVEKIAMRVFDGFFVKQTNNSWHRYIDISMFSILMRDNIFQGMMDFLRQTMQPTSVEIDFISLPKILYPVYYIFRPISLFWRKAVKRL